MSLRLNLTEFIGGYFESLKIPLNTPHENVTKTYLEVLLRNLIADGFLERFNFIETHSIETHLTTIQRKKTKIS